MATSPTFWSYLTVLTSIISYLESLDFAIQSGLASGVATLHSFYEHDQKLQLLVEFCKNERAVAVFLIGHMVNLSTVPFDERYTNPYEHAVAAYLYAITTSRTDLIHPAKLAALMLKQAHWPRRYVDGFLS